jgi:DNA helicase II / ATP-dependent DNA helicase PcrA
MHLTEEQKAIIQHLSSQDGRVLAGPGTGKSATAVQLLDRLREDEPDVTVRMLTFTRAATQEFAKKLAKAELDGFTPMTVHSFSLGLLVRNPDAAVIPLPLRIPDRYESGLIRSDVARRLRARGFEGVDSRKVDKLEREMAAGWESMDPDYTMLDDLEPGLRSAYLGHWLRHRTVFGYTLLAEMPYRGVEAMEDFELDLGSLHLLIVDEYQDLNRADIRLVELLRERGVRILAIGDDDQSIYGFRMAAPEGIRMFCDDFPGAADYPLSESFRCGSHILDAAVELIEGDPDRPVRPRLHAHDPAKQGHFAHVRFGTEKAEAEGVARMVRARMDSGVPPGEIIVLVRSSLSNWVALLGPAMEDLGIAVVDTDWVARALEETRLRKVIALLRIAVHREDSLAWWSLLHETRGLNATAFTDYILARAQESGRTFGQELLAAAPSYPDAPTKSSARRARELVEQISAAAEGLGTEASDPKLGEDGWGGWIVDRFPDLDDAGRDLLLAVGTALSDQDDLGSFLGQLEPIGKDLATQADAVRIMTFATSKGLTVDSAFVMGVEAGIVPLEHATDLDEERRLLYVAMTRAENLCVLSSASRRTGPIAWQGKPRVGAPRGRSPLLAGLSYARPDNGSDLVAEVVAGRVPPSAG